METNPSAHKDKIDGRSHAQAAESVQWGGGGEQSKEESHELGIFEFKKPYLKSRAIYLPYFQLFL